MSLEISCFSNASLFQPYDPTIYQSVPDFLAVRDNVGPLRPALLSVGAVICRHNLHEVMGLGLLHSHFEQAEDEILVWRQPTADGWSGGIVKRREAISACPILWKVELLQSGEPSCFPIEFFERAEGWLETNHDPAAMRDIINKLVEVNLTDVVGLRALHPDVHRRQDWREFVETGSRDDRTLAFVRMTDKRASSGRVTETGWSFLPTSGDGAEVGCTFDCISINDCGGAI